MHKTFTTEAVHSGEGYKHETIVFAQEPQKLHRRCTMHLKPRLASSEATPCFSSARWQLCQQHLKGAMVPHQRLIKVITHRHGPHAKPQCAKAKVQGSHDAIQVASSAASSFSAASSSPSIVKTSQGRPVQGMPPPLSKCS